MSKYILVPATGSETDALVFTVALAIARRSAGHVKFLHIRPDLQAIVAAMAASGPGSRRTNFYEIIGSLETNMAGRQQRAETAFHEVCEREQIVISNEASSGTPSAEWAVATGDEADGPEPVFCNPIGGDAASRIRDRYSGALRDAGWRTV